MPRLSVPQLSPQSAEPLTETLWYHLLQGSLMALLSLFAMLMRCLAALHKNAQD